MKAKSDEENKGGGAADARRWNGLRNVVESRALLKTAFRTASTLKAQVLCCTPAIAVAGSSSHCATCPMPCGAHISACCSLLPCSCTKAEVIMLFVSGILCCICACCSPLPCSLLQTLCHHVISTLHHSLPAQILNVSRLYNQRTSASRDCYIEVHNHSWG